MPTIATAMKACSSADANDSTMPRRHVSSLATRYDEITALPWPGPAAWKMPYANERPSRLKLALPSALAARFARSREGAGGLLLRGLEVGAAALVFAFGALLLMGYMATERMFAV